MRVEFIVITMRGGAKTAIPTHRIIDIDEATTGDGSPVTVIRYENKTATDGPVTDDVTRVYTNESLTALVDRLRQLAG